MPTLAERRAQVAAQGGNNSGDFIRFKKEGESRILRFLFTDANNIISHRKFWDKEAGQWIIDGDQGSYKITFNCVEYDKGGANPRRVRFEISEYLYNEYLAPYIEKEVPASKNVWEIQVRRPGSMDISYVAFKIDGATELTYPIPEASTTNSNSGTSEPAAPTYATPTPQTATASQPTAPVSTAAPSATPTVQAPKKSKYF